MRHNTLKEKLQDAGITTFYAEDVHKVNDVLAENNFEVSLDFVPNCTQDISATSYAR